MIPEVPQRLLCGRAARRRVLRRLIEASVVGPGRLRPLRSICCNARSELPLHRNFYLLLASAADCPPAWRIVLPPLSLLLGPRNWR